MTKFFLFLLLTTLTACGQSVSDHINETITTTKTNRHVNIPGTRLYMIPPEGFTLSETFIGLQKGENAGFNIYDLVGGNYYSNARTFSQAEFEKQGAKVFDYREIKVNGYPAKYIYMQGDQSSKSHALVFGDATFSTMIMGIFPSADEKTGNEMLNSLNEIWYDPEKVIDPLETANFTLDESVSKFKFLLFSSNLYIYSIDGIDNGADPLAPMVLVSQLPKDQTMSSKSIAEMMTAKLQQNGMTDIDFKNASTKSIKSYETYQVEVHGKLNGGDVLIYYSVTSKADRSIVVQGIAKTEFETTLDEFKKLANTVIIK